MNRQKAMLAAADKWVEDEMWNQRDRRPADLHDAAAFVRGFNAGYRAASGLQPEDGESRVTGRDQE